MPIARNLLSVIPFLLVAVAACTMDTATSETGAAATEPKCGGPGQPECGPACTDTAQCGAGICAGDGHCTTAVGIDGVKNGDETDIDCGGSQSPKCGDGKTCSADTGCTSGMCRNGICTAARGDDGLKNGDESDVDCGGTKTGAPKCATGKACSTNGDCKSDGCSYTKVCLERPSCVPHFGGDTCGAGEPDGVNQHESCCKAADLPVPGKPVQMDKYQVTAGRMRVFLDAVKGNVRAFVKQRRPQGWDPVWDDYVPNGWDVDPTITNDPDYVKTPASSVWHQLGGTALTHKLGRDGLPFRYGCDIKGNGTHTYRMPDDVQTNVLKDIPHKYSQEVLDAKAMNCVTSIMLMAFCEWDWPGSRLPTYEETRYAWHGGDPANHKYPWGNTPAPVGFLYEGDVFGPNSGAPEPSGVYGQYAVVPNNAAGVIGNIEYANWKYNYGYPANPYPNTFYPDFSAHIAAPGRFPKGNGPFGHADLAGNLFDLTSSISGQQGQNPDEREVTWGRNGAWEGHELPFASESGPWTAVIMRKYGKAGGRCVKAK